MGRAISAVGLIDVGVRRIVKALLICDQTTEIAASFAQKRGKLLAMTAEEDLLQYKVIIFNHIPKDAGECLT